MPESNSPARAIWFLTGNVQCQDPGLLTIQLGAALQKNDFVIDVEQQ